MTFKEFLQNEGMFGSPTKINPGTMFHRMEKRLHTHPALKKGTSVKRMTSGPKVTTPPMPTGITLAGKPATLPSHTDRPKKIKKVKSLLGIM